MSTQQRKPKKRSLLSRILCCSSPDLEEQPSHQRPSSQDSKKATQQLQNTPADPISTSPQRPPISAQSESEKIDQTTDVNQSQDAVVPQDRDVTSEKSQASPTAMFGHAASPISGLEPPLERNDGDTLTVLPLSTSSHESATEEKLALTEDEPLVPASAAMTATEPVDERSSDGIVVSSAPVEDESIWLLPKLSPELQGRKCLVLDLDETLVHSSFKVIHQADFVVPVEIDGIYHNVYVIKRPGVDDFMLEMGKHFEIVVFTASLAKYADPVLDILDVHKVVHHRLFRESCHNHQGNYVKDLSQLGRDLKTAIIIDNSPASYVFHPAHAVPISSWFNDIHDTELTDLIPFLKDLTTVEDISQILELSLQ